MSEPEVREIDPGIYMIDHHFQGLPGVIASYLLADGGGLTLIETGPGSTQEALLAGIRAAGFDPEGITQVLVTHIHLDHAGGAGSLLRHLPQARLFVHPVGAPHLVDPSKLLASATRIYGDQMERLWGEILPVPEERLSVLEDAAELQAGGRTLVALDTPGHAAHHLAFHEPRADLLFTGDVAAVRLGHSPHVRPPTPPPELDLELWKRSVARMRALRPRRLLLTHFGPFDDVDWHLDELLARLFFWAGEVDGRLQAGEEAEAAIAALHRLGDEELRADTGSEELAAAYELATPYHMTVGGIARYFRKQRERAG
jgi:glyoxylase-like metal-dependent hydrolase (beta-lactamase superfamily II)